MTSTSSITEQDLELKRSVLNSLKSYLEENIETSQIQIQNKNEDIIYDKDGLIKKELELEKIQKIRIEEKNNISIGTMFEMEFEDVKGEKSRQTFLVATIAVRGSKTNNVSIITQESPLLKTIKKESLTEKIGHQVQFGLTKIKLLKVV